MKQDSHVNPAKSVNLGATEMRAVRVKGFGDVDQLEFIHTLHGLCFIASRIICTLRGCTTGTAVGRACGGKLYEEAVRSESFRLPVATVRLMKQRYMPRDYLHFARY